MKPNYQFALICACEEPGTQRLEKVSASGYEDFNKAIEADVGDVIRVRSITRDIPEEMRKEYGIESIDMWIDDEGRMKPYAIVNTFATVACGQVIYGNALFMCSNASGDSFGLPLPILDGIAVLVAAVNSNTQITEAIISLAKERERQWFEETGGTGFKITPINDGGEA